MSSLECAWQQAGSQNHRFLLDNGAYMIKASLGGPLEGADSVSFFNAVLKDKHGPKSSNIVIGNQALADILEGRFNPRYQQIVHPQIRGILQDSNLQSLIWSDAVQDLLNKTQAGKSITNQDQLLDHLQQSCLAFTVQPCLPAFVQERYAEMVFEDFQFDAMAMVSSHSMILEHMLASREDLRASPCHLVVDSGFSFTYAVPFFSKRPLKHAALRLDVGGKLLTNLLTETISVKEFNLQGEFGVVNDIKEKSCFVSPDESTFKQQMEQCNKPSKKNPVWREYALPDYQHIKQGFLLNRESEHDVELARTGSLSVVNLTNERFLVPEVLFRPNDIGLQQGGIAEMIHQVINQRIPAQFQNLSYKNILVAGGNARIPGFAERLGHEIDHHGLLNDMVDKCQIFNSESSDPQNYSKAAIKGL